MKPRKRTMGSAELGLGAMESVRKKFRGFCHSLAEFIARHADGKKRPSAPQSAVSVAAVADAVNGDRIPGLIEENAVVADAQAEQSFEFATERLHATGAGTGVAMNRFEDVECSLPLDGADLRLHIRVETNLLQARSARLGETQACHHLFKRKAALGVLPEVFA